MQEILSRLFGALFACVFLFALACPVTAAEPAVKCEAGKLKTASNYGACRLKAESVAVKKGLDEVDHSKCDEKFGAKWDKAEGKGGDSCPTSGDRQTIEDEIGDHCDKVALMLSGVTTTTLPCGNGVLDEGEQCDDGNRVDGDGCEKCCHYPDCPCWGPAALTLAFTGLGPASECNDSSGGTQILWFSGPGPDYEATTVSGPTTGADTCIIGSWQGVSIQELYPGDPDAPEDSPQHRACQAILRANPVFQACMAAP